MKLNEKAGISVVDDLIVLSNIWSELSEDFRKFMCKSLVGDKDSSTLEGSMDSMSESMIDYNDALYDITN